MGTDCVRGNRMSEVSAELQIDRSPNARNRPNVGDRVPTRKPSPPLHLEIDCIKASGAAPRRGFFARGLKRGFDIGVSAVGLLLAVPVFVAVAVLIKLDSRGPVFYRCVRWGKDGNTIRIWKFRTMVDGAAKLLTADQQLERAFAANEKLVGDPRVTRVGRLLRRLSIDELPQLYNVLIGDMSVVGPRPKLIREAERYGPALDAVLAVRPGLTGLWQVSGRNLTTYDERIRLDLQYASHPSLRSDLTIIVRTVPVVLKGTGAH